ncbi:Ribokinase-like protein, partial [Dendrothele bispora CBS 962.96]
RSLVVYEPIPSACSPDHYSALRDVLPNIDIFSPNHEELELFFDISERIPHHDFCQRIESYCETYHDLGAKTIIVRAGSHGSFISNRNEAFGKIGSEWLPPYWTPDEATQMVKNTTGAGNSFLGGLCAGLYLAGDDVFRAARYGSVSASFIIQQAGLPLLDISETGEEYWNGESAEERLDSILRRGCHDLWKYTMTQERIRSKVRILLELRPSSLSSFLSAWGSKRPLALITGNNHLSFQRISLMRENVIGFVNVTTPPDREQNTQIKATNSNLKFLSRRPVPDILCYISTLHQQQRVMMSLSNLLGIFAEAGCVKSALMQDY